MLLFRLVDLPRRVRRLAAPVPLDPAATDTPGAAGPPLVGWTLEPTLLNAGSHRLRTRVARVIALYAEAEGQPRAVVETLSPRIEEGMGNYRLGRCIARAASSCVTLHLAASETAALKDLYRHAKALHVGVDITQGVAEDALDLTLYGPGSRALVRSRAAIPDGGGPDQTRGRAGGTTATAEP